MKEYLPYAFVLETNKTGLDSIFSEWEREVVEYLWMNDSKWVDSQEIKTYLDTLDIETISKASVTVFLNSLSQVSFDDVPIINRDKEGRAFVFKANLGEMKFRFAIGKYLKDFVQSNIINGA